MDFSELYTVHGRFISHLVDMAVKNENASYYHMANVWLAGLVNPRKEEMTHQYLNYLKSGSTIYLKKLLCDWTDFDHSDIFHFNTFCFIDSAKISFKI